MKMSNENFSPRLFVIALTDLQMLKVDLLDGLKQSRKCGKGVDLGLFPSDSLQSQLCEFIEIAHIDHTMV